MKNNSSKIKTWICGITGKMGQHLIDLQDSFPFEVVGGHSKDKIQLFSDRIKHQVKDFDQSTLTSNLNQVDLILDFSCAEATLNLLETIKQNNLQQLSVLVATTGFDGNQQKKLDRHIEENPKLHNKILFAPNTSLGIWLMRKQVASISKSLEGKGFDIELVETHHNQKTDSPSGTAKSLLKAIDPNSTKQHINNYDKKREPNQIGVHSLRGGGIFGEHTIRFISEFEEISMTHRALSRKLFASGAYTLSSWLIEQNSGVYSLDDVII